MMKTAVRLRILFGFCALTWALPATSGGPTALELVKLPKFCWAQYNPSLKGPEFEIRDCGVGMNHYCPGLVALQRSEKPGLHRSKQIAELRTAKRGTVYTLDYMRPYPNCPIRSHVEATLLKVNARLAGAR